MSNEKEQKMTRKDKNDLITALRTMKAGGEFANLTFVDAPWHNQLWASVKMRYYRMRMKKLLERET